MSRTIKLQPIQGKFVSATNDGKVSKIWLVNPETNEQGTDVEYDEAISLLAMKHPVVTTVQIKGKDGKFVKQLTDEDLALIEKRKQENTFGRVEAKPTNNSSLEKLVETQAELIKNQSKQIEFMQTQFVEMQKNLEKLMKKNKD